MGSEDPARTYRSRSSRLSSADAGWGCTAKGSFIDLLPAKAPRFSWLRPSVLWRSRNDVLARLFDDPTDDARRRWVAAQQAGGVGRDALVDRTDLDAFSFLLLGDTGEGDKSQFAAVPGLLRAGADTAFMVICSDVIYPTGSVNDYPERFFLPYREYPGPIYALPGNHDWYDGLTGFMRVFCEAPPLPRPEPRPRPFSRAWLRDLLWAKPDPADEAELAAARELRGAPEQRALQPGPYWVLDTGPLRIIGIDTGITGHIDSGQAAWLRRVSAGRKPKLLLTGQPIYVDNEYRPCSIEGGGTVDEIVRDPEHGYVAVIGGNIHNYQRYPVRVGEREIQYVVAGGGGAFMSATHLIGRVNVAGVDEDDFRCYPLRGDSLSFYSHLYDRRLRTRGLLAISPEQASALLAEWLGTRPTREEARRTAVARRTRRVAAILWRLPTRRFFHRWFSEFSDWDEPPFFKSFLRLDVDSAALRIRCFAATGCGEHELDPPLEDEVTIPLLRWS
ncbi:MAG: metallophosphoesterase [Streptosporangiales bacterium]|nr:metallophosphoesterase [Streptosporangiales bacterium]